MLSLAIRHWRFIAAVLLVLALLGALYAFGERRYAAGEDAANLRWKTAEQERLDVERELRAENQRLANRSSASHEATRARIALDLTEARHALRNALSAPISCPAGPSATVGDFVVPGAALWSVRRAAAGAGGAPGPAASQPGATVR